MKKYLVIFFIFSLISSAESIELKNPGDVMVDFESFSLEECASECKEVPDKLNFPPLPEEFSDKWTEQNVIGDKKYNLYKDWVYAAGTNLDKLGIACLIGKKEACNLLVNSTEKIIKEDFLKPKNWSGWPHDSKKVKSSAETFIFFHYFAGPMIENYAIALKATEKKPVKEFKEWFYRRYEPYLRKYTHQTGHWKDERVKKYKLKGKKVPQNHLLLATHTHLAVLSIINDPEKFEQELQIWDLYMKTMNKDGSLPFEADRGAKAFMYTGRTIMGLLKLAHLAEIQGIDLWSRTYKKDWQNLHHAISFFLDALNKNKIIYKHAKINESAGSNKKYKEQEFKYFPTEISFYTYYKKKFPNHPNIKKFENLTFDKKTCKVPKKIRMKYCTSEDQIITFKEIFNSDKKRVNVQNKFMGHRCFYLNGKYKVDKNEYSKKTKKKAFEYIAIVKNKLDDKVIIKIRTDSKEQAIEEAMKKCTDKHENGCYVHYSSQVAFGG